MLGPGYTGFVGHGKILSFTLSAVNSLERILGLGGRREVAATWRKVVEALAPCGSCSAKYWRWPCATPGSQAPGLPLLLPCSLTSPWSSSPVAFLSHIVDVSVPHSWCMVAFLTSRCPLQESRQPLVAFPSSVTTYTLRNIQQPLPTVLRVTKTLPQSLPSQTPSTQLEMPPSCSSQSQRRCLSPEPSLVTPSPSLEEPAPHASEFPPPVTPYTQLLAPTSRMKLNPSRAQNRYSWLHLLISTQGRAQCMVLIA